ncbi:ORF MSV177 hypothetical protein [Melanoplus sanguinipes entomopoxvirus]|uniref:Uncharacterized protein n=1 Tax=Melanoplus sanguinipes entomopoxvirus TaxID=83191 RepID=Q9YVR5_MSEPV|nr:ORF MSV177 hypothetical protein [Melanoplus sanguinipes entomopoxvirus]AAC97772.1 ORF MSV177 hypothetical protein [Melanoplus sanguinipes entomopoxvirus 'O']
MTNSECKKIRLALISVFITALICSIVALSIILSQKHGNELSKDQNGYIEKFSEIMNGFTNKINENEENFLDEFEKNENAEKEIIQHIDDLRNMINQQQSTSKNNNLPQVNYESINQNPQILHPPNVQFIPPPNQQLPQSQFVPLIKIPIANNGIPPPFPTQQFIPQNSQMQGVPMNIQQLLQNCPINYPPNIWASRVGNMHYPPSMQAVG